MELKNRKPKSTSKRRDREAAADEMAAIRYERERLKLERAKLALARDEARLAAMKEADDARATGKYETTLEDLAARFGMSRQCLAGMMRQPGAPRKHGNKGYLVKEWGEWLLTPAPISEEKQRTLRLRTAIWNARAEELERRNAERAAKFVPTDEVISWTKEYWKSVLDAVALLPQMVAARLPDSEVAAVVARETMEEVRHIVAAQQREMASSLSRPLEEFTV